MLCCGPGAEGTPARPVRERGPAAARGGVRSPPRQWSLTPSGKHWFPLELEMFWLAPVVSFGSEADFPRSCFEMASLQWNCSNPTHLPQVTGCGSRQVPETCTLSSGEETFDCQICLVIAFSEVVMFCFIPLKALAEYRLTLSR